MSGDHEAADGTAHATAPDDDPPPLRLDGVTKQYEGAAAPSPHSPT
ncbi:hypothetical protein SY89_03467 [Halolamina pelagica]|uniref:Uncharacterized protein n=1 Tax=Halolamina pelagica TaxID=699431 RepID=A0A0P7HRD7_9EURY|nr:hypothetical protein SY89_03467 [Halolamina pelagica]